QDFVGRAGHDFVSLSQVGFLDEPRLSAAEDFLSDEAARRAGRLVVVARAPRLGDQNGKSHAEERYEQADDGEATGKHSGSLLLCDAECPQAPEPPLRCPFM